MCDKKRLFIQHNIDKQEIGADPKRAIAMQLIIVKLQIEYIREKYDGNIFGRTDKV